MQPSPVRLGWYAEVGRSHAGSRFLYHLACPDLHARHRGVAIGMEYSGMSTTTRLSEARLELALPGAPGPVQEWVGSPANSLDAPPKSGLWSGRPQVIYAEYKPRLTGPELRARYRGAAMAAAPDEGYPRKVARSSAPTALRDRAGKLGQFWWSALVVAAVVFSAGTPVF